MEDDFPSREPEEKHASFPDGFADGRYVVGLDGHGHGSDVVGSKAASIDRLIAAGFAVPPAVAATIDAYRYFITETGLDELIHQVRTSALPRPGDGERLQAEIEEAFLEPVMPPALEGELRRALSLAGLGVVSVRSSSGAEDLSGASFAGQYLSVLDVAGPDDVLTAIRRVWASLWSPWARAYRHQLGFGEDELAMGVIVQRMVPADRSGVAFTIDPASPDVLRVEVVDGLGERLVSGQVTPDVHQLRRPGLRPVGNGPVDPGLRRAAHTALRIEERFGGVPQDVEWSLVGDQLWILQARPITRIIGTGDVVTDGFDTGLEPADRYAATGVTEMLPGVLSPMLWTINGPMVEESFRDLFDDLGYPSDDHPAPFGFIARSRGQAGLNLSAVQRAGSRISGWSPADVEELYLGSADSATDDGSSGGGLRNLIMNYRAFRVRGNIEREVHAFEGAVGRVLDHRPEVATFLDAELVAYRWRIRDLAANGLRSEVAAASAAVAAYRGLEALIGRWLGDEAPAWTQRITGDAAGMPQNPVAVARRLLDELDDRDRDKMMAALCQEDAADIEAAASSVGPWGKQFAAELAAGIERLGSAAVYGGSTWSEEEAYVRLLLRRLPDRPVTASASGDLVLLEQLLTKTWKWRVTRVFTGQVVDMRRRMLRRLSGDARSLLGLRESAKATLLALGGEERRVMVAAGVRLAERGVLDRPEDIELLADWELDDILLGGIPPTSASLAGRRDAVKAWRRDPGTPFHGLDAVTEDGALSGWGASPGRHRGIVKVVFDPQAVDHISKGDVLVARATDPSWTPLMQDAGALVIEQGGPLSHAAIVAREFGIPAVLNAAGATTLLGDGQFVEVDGTGGRVTPLGGPAAGEAAGGEGDAS